MAKPLNFNNVKKTFLSVTLADENKTTLFIGTPTKAIMDDLLILQSSLIAVNENEETNPDTVNDLYRACARVMSRNKQGKHISSEFLEDLFDFEDIMIFFDAYMGFVEEVTNSKN